MEVKLSDLPIIDPKKAKVHWTHRIRIKKLYKQGYSTAELSDMYRLPEHYIKSVVVRIERNIV